MKIIIFLLLSALIYAGDAKSVPYAKIDWSNAPPGPPGHTRTAELRHPTTKDVIMRYQVFAPSALPQERTLGLIVGFHGQNGDEQGALRGHKPMSRIGLDGEYICAGGKALGKGWDLVDEERLLQFIDWLLAVYPIDRRRVFYWGHSNGGWAVGTFGSRHADRVAGVVRYSGYGGLSDVRSGDPPPLEWYMVHGDIDKAVDVSGSRNIRLDLIAGRHRFVYREIIGGDHTSNLLFNVPTGDDAARWVHHLRHKSVMPSQVDMDLLKGLFKAKEADLDVKLADPDIWKRLVRIGGPHAWAVIGKAMKSKAAAVRTAFAKACGSVSLEGEMTVSSLVKLLSDVDSDVRMASISSLGVLANWRGATAQSALARFASDSRMDDLERTAAAASLAAVLTLPLQGNLADDAPAIEGVLSLLDSDLESVRVAVASPLRIASQDSFGYDPSATVPSRKAAIAACRAWFAERSGKKSVTPKSK